MSCPRQSHEQFQELPLAHRIDMICDDFEEAWNADEKPRIEDFLLGTSIEEQPSLLRELLPTELECRRKREEVLSVEPYTERFPQFADVVRSVFMPQELSTTSDPTFVWIRGLLVGDDSESELGDLDSGAPAGHHEIRASDPTVAWVRGLVASDEFESKPGDLFSAVPAEVLETSVIEQEFAPGESLMRQGEQGTKLMVICEGFVDVSTVDMSGKTHLIDRSGRGDLLGEMSLLTAQPCTANVVAVDRVRALTISADTFHELTRQYPTLSVILTNLVADRLGKPGRDALTDKMLDRYRIKRRLGRGGMGIVYEAEDIESDERVALKMMSHRLVYSADGLQRFRQEADIITTFDHPNIVKMKRRFAAFHTYFMAMEFCEGETLQQTLAREGAISISMFKTVLGQLASALIYAHQANVIHRDIKPANIMLGLDGRVKLMDFGLAEPVSVSQLPSRRVCGTPRFMAPEQRIGKGVGKEADYFALGCVAYEMLTSQHLFGGRDMKEVTRDFTKWKPPQFRKLRLDLPEEACLALQPSLEKDHRRRRLDLELISTWSPSR